MSRRTVNLNQRDRLLLALTDLMMTYELREGRLSDGDCLDVAEAWTTDAALGTHPADLDFQFLADALMGAALEP